MSSGKVRPDGLSRSIVLAALRPAGDEGLTFEDLAALVADVDGVIAELRARGHVIQTRRPDPGRVILHEPTRKAAA